MRYKLVYMIFSQLDNIPNNFTGRSEGWFWWFILRFIKTVASFSPEVVCVWGIAPLSTYSRVPPLLAVRSFFLPLLPLCLHRQWGLTTLGLRTYSGLVGPTATGNRGGRRRAWEGGTQQVIAKNDGWLYRHLRGGGFSRGLVWGRVQGRVWGGDPDCCRTCGGTPSIHNLQHLLLLFDFIWDRRYEGWAPYLFIIYHIIPS